MRAPEWQKVQEDIDRRTDRGGWLYLVTEKGDRPMSIINQMMVFVPKPAKGGKDE